MAFVHPVMVGDGAMHTIDGSGDPDDSCGLVRSLCQEIMGDIPPEAVRAARSIVDSYNYLLCSAITHKEAYRRLRILRGAYQTKVEGITHAD